jgi:hypothetical protein
MREDQLHEGRSNFLARLHGLISSAAVGSNSLLGLWFHRRFDDRNNADRLAQMLSRPIAGQSIKRDLLRRDNRNATLT